MTFLGGAFLASIAEADTSGGAGVGGYAGVLKQANKLAHKMGLSVADRETFTRLLLVQSYSESKGNIKAANTSPSESAAAKRLYFARGNDAALLAATGIGDTSAWWPGSAGWFGLLPATLVNVVRRKHAKGIGLGPRSNQDPWASVIMYAAYLDRLRRRSEWKRSSQDAYALKAGGAAGSLMDDPGKERYKIAARHLDSATKALGIPASFRTQKIAVSRIFGGRDWLALFKGGL